MVGSKTSPEMQRLCCSQNERLLMLSEHFLIAHKRTEKQDIGFLFVVAWSYKQAWFARSFLPYSYGENSIIVLVQ